MPNVRSVQTDKARFFGNTTPQELAAQYGTPLYIEDTPLLTDLFPLSLNQGKFNILFYRAGHILDQYLRLKERKANLVAERAYFGGNRSQLAWEYGRLLSYPDEAIRRLISDNPEKERL